VRVKTLPTFYYLDHFKEFLAYVDGPCQHLLEQKHRHFITQFESYSKPQQCLIARAANRKHSLIAISSLQYAEIENWLINTEFLIEQSWFRAIEERDLTSVLPQLTKAQLLSLLREQAQSKIKSSLNKSSLVTLALESVTIEQFQNSPLNEVLVVRNFDEELSYFLFLFFGHINGDLSRFSLRDMGIMRTRGGQVSMNARFALHEEANSAFWYAKWRKSLAISDYSADKPIKLNELPVPNGSLAERYREECLYKLGKSWLSVDIDIGLELLKASGSDLAREKWLRETYKLGESEKSLVKKELEQLIDEPCGEALSIFAEDFYTRKFGKKRTSVLTDMLNNASNTLQIDLQYVNQVENGVIDWYKRNELNAFHTENRLWLSLFGIVFWDLLYAEQSQSLANEFDFKPTTLKENKLYFHHSNDIELILQNFENQQNTLKYFLKQVSKYHGKVSFLVDWHPSLIDTLILLVKLIPSSQLSAMLRMMSQDFKSLRDGFPDLMVIDNQNVRFEEVKAPGDQLRRNQMVTLKKMKEAGLTVQIIKVDWVHDPMQPYVIVDIETTGGGTGNHRITEIGMVKQINGQVVAEWQSLVNPQRHIPANITALTGIDNAMVADAPTFSELADSIEEFCQDSIFVAHNVNFDYGFFKYEFGRLDRNFKRPKVCTVREMRKAFPGLKSYSLANLTERFDIKMEQHHRAMSDALAAAELLNLSQNKLRGSDDGLGNDH
jgi:DNA polymerase-3 subunit epsilon